MKNKYIASGLLKGMLFIALFTTLTFNTFLMSVQVASAQEGEVSETESVEVTAEVEEIVVDKVIVDVPTVPTTVDEPDTVDADNNPEEEEKVEFTITVTDELNEDNEFKLSVQAPKVTICHVPEGNPSEQETIPDLSAGAASAHLNNHALDYEGECEPIDQDEDEEVVEYPYGVITYPVTDYDEEEGQITLLAEYYDGDSETDDAVQWAVRFETCSANTGTVFGNVDGHSDAYNWAINDFDGMHFSADIDLDTLTPGSYCFVFNPTDDNGETDVRETRWFTVPEPVENACNLKTIYGVNDNGDLNEVDPDTGAVSFVKDLEFGSWAVTVDSETGIVYYLSTNGDNLGTYDPVTENTSSFAVTGDSIGDTSRLAYNPADGFMYVGDQNLNLFTLTAGGVATSLGTISGITTGGGDIAFGPDGTMYLTGHDGLLYTVDYSGIPTATLLGDPGLARPSGLAWRDGGLYISNMSDGDNDVQIYFINLEDVENPIEKGGVNEVRNQDLGSCVDYEEPVEPEFYGLYCGNGDVDQEWEQCDAGLDGDDSCTAQCQLVDSNMCTDLVIAQVVTLPDRALNQGNGDMTSDVYVGQDSTPIPSGAWFPLYYMGSYFNDPDVNGAEGYEDVPGYAIERQDGQVRLVMHGGQTGEDDEFAEGYINFWGVTPTDQVADNEGDNVLENPFDGTHNEPFADGNDELDLEGNMSKFILKVSTGDDGFYTTYSDVPVCTVPDGDGEGDGGGDATSTPPTEDEDGRQTISGGSVGNRSSAGSVLGAFSGDVLGDSTCTPYLTSYLRIGSTNTEQVTKLQSFLNTQGISVPVTGVFGLETDSAVRSFQTLHKVEVLDPWAQIGFSSQATGYVFKTTKWKINDLVCPGIAPFPILP